MLRAWLVLLLATAIAVLPHDARAERGPEKPQVSQLEVVPSEDEGPRMPT